MLTCKTNRYKNNLISYQRDYRFRDDIIIAPKRLGHFVFMTTFSNIFRTYEILTVPLPNGTYKIKVVSTDDLGNVNVGVESTVVIDFYPLPPANVAVTVIGYVATLTWEHSANGAPDYYVIYGNGGSGNIIDRTTPLATIAGSLLTKALTLSSGQWKFVVEAKNGLVESSTMNIVSAAVPPTIVIPPKPGVPGAPTGLSLERVSVGKVKVKFLWTYGSQAATFNIYHDDGTGTINYAIPKFTFSRLSKMIQEYTTTQLHSEDVNKTYRFAVRAVSSDGVEETNTDEYTIDVDGVSPDNVEDLTLSTIF